jgi:pimeloyl-ACP methyl ester carboxylesterase
VRTGELPTGLVVVLPGIMGTQLRKDSKLVWGPSAGSAMRAITTFGRSVKSLRLPAGIGDDDPGDGVESAGLMPDLHVLPGLWTPVKGYDWLLGRLRHLGYRDVSDDPDAPPGNLIALGYDWRLSNRRSGQLIAAPVGRALERWRAQGGRYTDARVIFVCHSMGGLVARWYIERCGGHEITGKLITLGTPYRGAARALEQLVNGVHSGLGSFALNLTSFARSLPSLHQLMPDYACIERGNELVKTTETVLPELRTADIDAAMTFHAQLRAAETARPDSLAHTHAIVGFRQPTTTTVRIRDGQVFALGTYHGEDLAGDATVPIVAACRAGVPMDSPLLRRICDKHGNLHRNRAAFDEVEGILTARNVDVRAGKPIDIAVMVPELILAGEDLPVSVRLPDVGRAAVRLEIIDESGRVLESRVMRPPAATIVTDLPPGAHTVRVIGMTPGASPVSSSVLVWDSAWNDISGH